MAPPPGASAAEGPSPPPRSTPLATPTAEIQILTGYTVIYENWNVGLSGGSTSSCLWYFGTTSTYYTLNNLA